MHTRTAAGQATVEYVTAVALVAAILVLAAPAVGAPDLGKLVVGKLRLALCVVGGDVCTDNMAREAGLAPCPLKTDLTGHEVSATAFSVELGHRLTLTVTPRSDGSVSVVRTASGTVGAADGPGASFSAGPVAFEAGSLAGARARIQAALGWEFADQATAYRFLEHARLNTVNFDDFPVSWVSVEDGAELSAMFGASVGAKRAKDRGQIFGFGGGLSGAIGGRKTRDGLYTVYGRASLDGIDIVLPGVPSIGPGRADWLIEYTFGHGSPRELVLRHGAPSPDGKRLTETVMRLDLRDPANLAAARPLLEVGRRTPQLVRDVIKRIETHGTVETSVSEVDDQTKGLAGSIAGDAKFGAEAKLIEVHRKLVSATARTGGPYERQRVDCSGEDFR